ncbi:hypothetical protein [Mesorhizobium sp. WSM4884]|uniref:hypothetical protein n=1 Tax=Mesorhizobium sp. WSM4884 TaxID=3038542 RepID=UPI002417D463|nr:hypothetical protein [Mesorhizobium sp. WSM4884]MDG4884473.1 hypothetical protein [Mesorhizobium sp. WSM4884]
MSAFACRQRTRLVAACIDYHQTEAVGVSRSGGIIAAGIRSLAGFHPGISHGALVGKTADPLLRVNGRLVRRIGIFPPEDVSMPYFANLPRHNFISICNETDDSLILINRFFAFVEASGGPTGVELLRGLQIRL